MGKFLSDIFSMNFDIVIPLSSCIVALAIGATLFCMRYFSYLRNKRRYEKRIQKEAESTTVASNIEQAPSETISG